MTDDETKLGRLDGQVIAISGAGGGIDREIALAATKRDQGAIK